MSNAVTTWTNEELSMFAAAVRTAAAAPQTAKYHGELAFISSLKAEWFPRTPRAMFDAMLIASLQEGLLRMSRADLVGAMDARMVAASEVRYMSCEWHFVVVEG
jgi:hypothetical protein